MSTIILVLIFFICFIAPSFYSVSAYTLNPQSILLPPSFAGQQVEIKALKQFKVGSGKDAPLATYAIIEVLKHDTHAINIEHALLIKEIIVE